MQYSGTMRDSGSQRGPERTPDARARARAQGVPADVWSAWRNKAGKDLVALSEERGSSAAYAVLARASGIVQERRHVPLEEGDAVWVLANGELQPRRATVKEDTLWVVSTLRAGVGLRPCITEPVDQEAGVQEIGTASSDAPIYHTSCGVSGPHRCTSDLGVSGG